MGYLNLILCDQNVEKVRFVGQAVLKGIIWRRTSVCKLSILSLAVEFCLANTRIRFCLASCNRNISWNSRATHMHHTSDTLYFKEYNLVIKHGLLLKLQLTCFVDACPPKITMPCIYISTSYEHWINTKYVHFNTCHVLISTNHAHKTQYIHYNSQHNLWQRFCI